jgi:hypothetical protein
MNCSARTPAHDPKAARHVPLDGSNQRAHDRRKPRHVDHQPSTARKIRDGQLAASAVAAVRALDDGSKAPIRPCDRRLEWREPGHGRMRRSRPWGRPPMSTSRVRTCAREGYGQCFRRQSESGPGPARSRCPRGRGRPAALRRYAAQPERARLPRTVAVDYSPRPAPWAPVPIQSIRVAVQLARTYVRAREDYFGRDRTCSSLSLINSGRPRRGRLLGRKQCAGSAIDRDHEGVELGSLRGFLVDGALTPPTFDTLTFGPCYPAITIAAVMYRSTI